MQGRANEFAPVLDVINSASANGDLAIIQTTRRDNGAPAFLLAAVGFDGAEYMITPLAELFQADPYETFTDPSNV